MNWAHLLLILVLGTIKCSVGTANVQFCLIYALQISDTASLGIQGTAACLVPLSREGHPCTQVCTEKSFKIAT